MPCERCGGQTCADVYRFNATFRTPNGVPLYLRLTAEFTSDALRLHPAWFCAACAESFLEALGEVGQAVRLTRAEG